MQDLPSTHRALVKRSFDTDPSVETVPTPKPTSGSAIVRILAAGIVSYMGDVYSGKRPMQMQMPLTIGTSAIGRIAAVGEDAVKLKPGQLVFVEQQLQI